MVMRQSGEDQKQFREFLSRIGQDEIIKHDFLFLKKRFLPFPGLFGNSISLCPTKKIRDDNNFIFLKHQEKLFFSQIHRFLLPIMVILIFKIKTVYHPTCLYVST